MPKQSIVYVHSLSDIEPKTTTAIKNGWILTNITTIRISKERRGPLTSYTYHAILWFEQE